jgi:triosephosphate isomerase
MKTLIAANWKMHGDLSWSAKPKEFRSYFPKSNKRVECLICPPSYMIAALAKSAKSQSVLVGAQNCHFEASGAFTGEISADMAADAGAAYVIVGHSERRAIFKESDKVVAQKAGAVLRAGLAPIVCIGESESQRRAGRELSVATRQLRLSLPKSADGQDMVIAYEPVWAIGSGLTPTLEDIETMHNHIRKLLARRFGADIANQIRILYGGSVKPNNAKDILAIENVNGALIGGASLDMKSFAKIAAAG